MLSLKPKHKYALRRVVEEAESWRGYLVGNPDTFALESFDQLIDTAKEALQQLGIKPPKRKKSN